MNEGEARDAKGLLARISIRLDEKVKAAPWGSEARMAAALALGIVYGCTAEIEEEEGRSWGV